MACTHIENALVIIADVVGLTSHKKKWEHRHFAAVFDHLWRQKEKYKIKHTGENLKYPSIILTCNAVKVGNTKVQHEVVTGDNKPEKEKANIDQPKMKNVTVPNDSQFWDPEVDLANSSSK